MSIASGPSIVNSGLVFNYDMNNTGRSWLGRPTTNTATGVSLGFGDRWSNVSTQDYPNKNNLPFGLKGPVWRLINGNNYWGYAGDFAITAGNTYTISGWYYVATTETMIWYNDVWNSSYSSVVTSVASDTFVSTNNTNGWRYGSKTLTVGAATSPFYVRGTVTSGSGDTTPTGNVYMANFQIEQQSFATPFVNGTRSNTQALLDLTGTNTLTATSLTYASNNTFSYNGSSDICQFPYTQSQPNNYTVEAWIYHTANSPDTNIGHQIVIPYSNYNGWIFSLNGPTSLLQLRAHNFSNSSTTYNLTYNTPLALNTWFHVAGVDNGTTVTLYVNGVSVATTPSVVSTTNGTMSCQIGAWAGAANTYFAGQIPVVRIYNRGLTATEISQNFNAQRSIYGI